MPKKVVLTLSLPAESAKRLVEACARHEANLGSALRPLSLISAMVGDSSKPRGVAGTVVKTNALVRYMMKHAPHLLETLRQQHPFAQPLLQPGMVLGDAPVSGVEPDRGETSKDAQAEVQLALARRALEVGRARVGTSVDLLAAKLERDARTLRVVSWAVASLNAAMLMIALAVGVSAAAAATALALLLGLSGLLLHLARRSRSFFHPRGAGPGLVQELFSLERRAAELLGDLGRSRTQPVAAETVREANDLVAQLEEIEEVLGGARA